MVGLPGSMDPVPKLVGVGPEEAQGTAPLLTILTAALVPTLALKHVESKIAQVSIANP